MKTVQVHLTLKALGFFLVVQHWGTGCFPHPLCKIRSRHPRELKLIGLVAYIMFYKICIFESSTITNYVITKNNGKIRTSAKPNKLYIIRKILMRAIQNVLFIEFEPLCQNVWAILSNFRFFYDARLPNMVMSLDPRSKFWKFFILS